MYIIILGLSVAYLFWKFTIEPLLRFRTIKSRTYPVKYGYNLPPPIGVITVLKERTENRLKLWEEWETNANGRDLFMFAGPKAQITVNNRLTLNHIIKSTELISKGMTYDFLKPLIGQSLLVNDGELWKSRRSLMNPAFHSRLLKINFTPIILKHSLIFRDFLRNEDKIIKIDVSKWLNLVALGILCETEMGLDFDVQSLKGGSQYISSIIRIFEIFSERIRTVYLWPSFIFDRTALGKEFAATVEHVRDFTKTTIKSRRNYRQMMDKGLIEKGPQILIDILLDTLDEEVIVDEITTFMIAGHHTAAIAMTWMLQVLASHSEMQSNLRATLVGKNKEIFVDDILHCKLLEYFIKECLRMYPAVDVISREVKEKTAIEINGQRTDIPVGTQIGIRIRQIHLSPNFWTNPRVFDPSRFDPESPSYKSDEIANGYLPFSLGPRNCIGKTFAMQEFKIFIAMVLSSFKIENLKKTELIPFEINGLLRPKEPVNIEFTQLPEPVDIKFG